MSGDPGIVRRRFLASVLWVGVGILTAPLSAWARFVGQSQRGSLGPKLVELLSHEVSARVIGRQYLRIAPREGNPQVLVDLITSGCPGSPEKLHEASRRELRELVHRRVRQDFEDERVVMLRGWMISVTEARLCALVVLRP